MKSKYFLHRLSLIALLLLVALSSCCDPKPRNSMPLVLDSTYSDTAIKDIPDRFDGNTDSAYYPIYSIDIKNTGIEADTFTLSYKRIRNGFLLPVTVKQWVPPGEVRTFRTEGPILDHGVPVTSDIVYVSFFVSTPDSIPIKIMSPLAVTLTYGSTETGDESCGSPGETITLDISKWE